MSQQEQIVAQILYIFIKKLNGLERLRLQLAQVKTFYPEQGFYFLKNFEKILNLYEASKVNPEVMYNQENYFSNYDQIANEGLSDGLILFQNLKYFLQFNRSYPVEEKVIGMALIDFTHTTSLVGINYEQFIKIFFPLSDNNARKRLLKMKCIYQDHHIYNKIEPIIQNIFGKILEKLVKLIQKAEELCLRLQSTPYFDPMFLFTKIDLEQKGFLCFNNVDNFLKQFQLPAFSYEQYYQLIFKLQGYNCLLTENHVRHLQDEISFQQFQNLIFPKFPYFKEQAIQQSMVNRSQFNDYSQLQSKTELSSISNISRSFANQSLMNNLFDTSRQNSQQPITNISQLPKTIHKEMTYDDPHLYKYQIIRADNTAPPTYISEAIQLKSSKFTTKGQTQVRSAIAKAFEKEGIVGVSKHQVREAQMPNGMGNNLVSGKQSFLSSRLGQNNQSQINSKANTVWLSQDQSQQLIHYTDTGNQEKYIDRTFLHFVGKQFVDNIYEKQELNSQLSAIQRKAYGQDINNPNLYQLSAAETNLISYLHPPETSTNSQCRILRPTVQVSQDIQSLQLSNPSLSEPLQTSSILKIDYNPVINVVDQKYLNRMKCVHENKLGIWPKEKKEQPIAYASVIGYNNLAQNKQINQNQSQLQQKNIFSTGNYTNLNNSANLNQENNQTQKPTITINSQQQPNNQSNQLNQSNKQNEKQNPVNQLAQTLQKSQGDNQSNQTAQPTNQLNKTTDLKQPNQQSQVANQTNQSVQPTKVENQASQLNKSAQPNQQSQVANSNVQQNQLKQSTPNTKSQKK